MMPARSAGMHPRENAWNVTKALLRATRASNDKTPSVKRHERTELGLHDLVESGFMLQT